MNMDRNDIEKLAKDLIPLAESINSGETLVTTDYNDEWDLVIGFRKKKKVGK